jgi:hypothetical protein
MNFIVGTPRVRSARNDSSMLLYIINVSVEELVSIVSVSRSFHKVQVPP